MFVFLNTAIEPYFVALYAKGTCVETLHLENSKNASSALLPLLKQLLKKNTLPLTDIQALGVVMGPGSFTGLRMGLTLIKSLSWAQNVPFVGISSMDTLAEVFYSSHPHTTPAVFQIPSRKGHVYEQTFSNRTNASEIVEIPHPGPPPQVALCPKTVCALGALRIMEKKFLSVYEAEPMYIVHTIANPKSQGSQP